jgi:hypothetical protein
MILRSYNDLPQQPKLCLDILEKDDKPPVNLSLMERKSILKESIKEGSHVVINDNVINSSQHNIKDKIKNKKLAPSL